MNAATTSRRLLPQYADCRVCATCGAAAEQFGSFHDTVHAGEAVRVFTPRQRTAKHRPTATHFCTRPFGVSPRTGKVDHDWDFECGALPITGTRKVREDEMPGRCFEGELAVVTQSEIFPRPDRKEQSAGL